MSTRQTGNRHENSVMEMAEQIGYASFAARGSRGPVDVICFDKHMPVVEYLQVVNGMTPSDEWAGTYEPRIPLVIQVGTTNKPIASTLAELDAAPRPIGSKCIVARRHKNPKSKRISWTWHSADGKFESLVALLQHTAPSVR